MVEQGITCPFLPHGLGHPLGLQVHDTAGFMQDDKGTHLSAPSKYPYLRCTRILQPRMVLTIGAGSVLHRILLAPWRNGEFSKYFNWERIDALKPYGGIRIEDNIVIHDNRVENMTRDLEAGLMQPYLIPASPVTVSEEIKKSFYHLAGPHQRGE